MTTLAQNSLQPEPQTVHEIDALSIENTLIALDREVRYLWLRLEEALEKLGQI